MYILSKLRFPSLGHRRPQPISTILVTQLSQSRVQPTRNVLVHVRVTCYAIWHQLIYKHSMHWGVNTQESTIFYMMFFSHHATVLRFEYLGICLKNKVDLPIASLRLKIQNKVYVLLWHIKLYTCISVRYRYQHFFRHRRKNNWYGHFHRRKTTDMDT